MSIAAPFTALAGQSRGGLRHTQTDLRAGTGSIRAGARSRRDRHRVWARRPGGQRRAYRTIQENLFVGVGVVHVLGITAALMGWIGPIEAALLHLGPDILVFVNSAKLLRVRIEGA